VRGWHDQLDSTESIGTVSNSVQDKLLRPGPSAVHIGSDATRWVLARPHLEVIRERARHHEIELGNISSDRGQLMDLLVSKCLRYVHFLGLEKFGSRCDCYRLGDIADRQLHIDANGGIDL